MEEDRPILNAPDVLAWRRGVRRTGRTDPIERALLVADRSAVEDVRRRRRGRAIDGPSGPVIVLQTGGTAVPGGTIAVAAPPGVGAPAAAIAVEELVALGAREIVYIGYAGGLDPALAAGDVIVIADALRDEGVSAQYGGAGPTSTADPAATTATKRILSQAGLEPRIGRSWTTDALYRETRSEVGRARASEAVVVDLETAAVFAVAVALGRAAAGALIVGDRLGSGRWEPPSDLEAIRRRLRAVADTMLDAWLAHAR
ncbi:MAG TPA: hypothetical protein VFR14_04565 [Candidatus Limnocylindrales bacterium]|nr:hypothetical protein [Candidatus Limnocylindrales bacterium]